MLICLQGFTFAGTGGEIAYLPTKQIQLVGGRMPEEAMCRQLGGGKLRVPLPVLDDSCFESSSRILGHLYVSSSTIATDVVSLRQLGITHIIDLSCSGLKVFEESSTGDKDSEGFKKYLRLDFRDRVEVDITPAFEQCFEVIEEAKRTGCKCMVFCSAGRSRSIAITLAYLIVVNKMTLIGAYKLVKSLRPMSSPNIGFMGSLVELELATHGTVTLDIERYAYNRYADAEELSCESHHDSLAQRTGSGASASSICSSTHRRVSGIGFPSRSPSPELYREDARFALHSPRFTPTSARYSPTIAARRRSRSRSPSTGRGASRHTHTHHSPSQRTHSPERMSQVGSPVSPTRSRAAATSAYVKQEETDKIISTSKSSADRFSMKSLKLEPVSDEYSRRRGSGTPRSSCSSSGSSCSSAQKSTADKLRGGDGYFDAPLSVSSRSAAAAVSVPTPTNWRARGRRSPTSPAAYREEKKFGWK